jgi:hypothetical protein
VRAFVLTESELDKRKFPRYCAGMHSDRKGTMPKARKTISVEDFRIGINNLLISEHIDCKPNADAIRQGLCIALDSALHEANAYKGFRYVGGYAEAKANGTEHKRIYY